MGLLILCDGNAFQRIQQESAPPGERPIRPRLTTLTAPWKERRTKLPQQGFAISSWAFLFGSHSEAYGRVLACFLSIAIGQEPVSGYAGERSETGAHHLQGSRKVR